MGARRKAEERVDAGPATPVAPRAATLGLAGARHAPGASPVHEQLMRLEASFREEVVVKPYPRPVRAAIMLGAPLALWAIVIVSVGVVARAVGA